MASLKEIYNYASYLLFFVLLCSSQASIALMMIHPRLESSDTQKWHNNSHNQISFDMSTHLIKLRIIYQIQVGRFLTTVFVLLLTEANVVFMCPEQ